MYDFKDGGIFNAGKLVEFFLSVVLHLNKKREANGHIPSVQEMMSVSTSEAKQRSVSVGITQRGRWEQSYITK